MHLGRTPLHLCHALFWDKNPGKLCWFREQPLQADGLHRIRSVLTRSRDVPDIVYLSHSKADEGQQGLKLIQTQKINTNSSGSDLHGPVYRQTESRCKQTRVAEGQTSGIRCGGWECFWLSAGDFCSRNISYFFGLEVIYKSQEE